MAAGGGRTDGPGPDAAEDVQVWTETAYLQKHGEAGRLKYPTFRAPRFAAGQRRVESNIRRVVNLRLKGNAIYWRDNNAEAMLQIRGSSADESVG